MPVEINRFLHGAAVHHKTLLASLLPLPGFLLFVNGGEAPALNRGFKSEGVICFFDSREAYASGVDIMPITLRNKTVEERIRRVGALTGEGPSAVIAHAIEVLETKLAEEETKKSAEKLQRLRALRQSLPSFSHEARAAVWTELDRINDELFDPSDRSQ